MRILIVNEALAGGGGVESYLQSIVPALRERGHEIAFLHQNSEAEMGPTRLVFDGVPRAGVADEGLDAAVGRMLAWEPDVCFSHNLRSLDIEERLLVNATVVKMMHGYFGTCVSGQKAHAFPHLVPCGRELGAACLGLYLPRRCGQLRPLTMFRQYSWAMRQNALLDYYAAVVVASEHMAREYRRHGAPAVTAAPLFSTEPLARDRRQAPDLPVVLFAGRMTHLKGGDTLLRAAVRANTWLPRPLRLLFAGDGPEQVRWRELAAELRVDATFLGWVTGSARTHAFRSASLVALPSLWPEPFGLVGLEAAAHGVPSVAFDVGGTGEWLRDGFSGLAVSPAGDHEELGRAIADLLNAPGELERLGAGARQVAAELTIEAHLDILDDVFARACDADVEQAGSAR